MLDHFSRALVYFRLMHYQRVVMLIFNLNFLNERLFLKLYIYMYFIIFKIFNSHNIFNNTNICKLFYYSSYLKNFFNSSKIFKFYHLFWGFGAKFKLLTCYAFFVDNALQRRHLISYLKVGRYVKINCRVYHCHILKSWRLLKIRDHGMPY